MAAQGLSLCELVRTSAMYSPARRASTLPHSTGPSPSGRSFGFDRRHCSSGSDPGPFALTPFLSTSPRSDSWHRFGRNFACAYIRPYPRGLQAGLCVACFSPFRLRVSHDSSHTFPMDDTRPPWVTDALPHRVARTHLGATGWNPCAFAPIVRARPFPVFGRPVHLPGLLPLITTRWFSSSLSDPASRLPSRRSPMVAPGQPIRVPAFAVVPHEPLHTFHPFWPVRHYPHLRISARGLGLSGTSTHLTRQLSGTHYAAVRLLMPSLAASSIGLPVGARDRRGDCGQHEVSQVPTQSLTARTGLRLRRSPRMTVPHMLPAAVRNASASTVRVFRSSI